MFDISTWTVVVTVEISIRKVPSSNLSSVIGFGYVHQYRCKSRDNA
jgi:hypothetical protein